MLWLLFVLVCLISYANYQLGEVRHGLFPRNRGIDFFAEKSGLKQGVPMIVLLARCTVGAVIVAMVWCLFAINR